MRFRTKNAPKVHFFAPEVRFFLQNTCTGQKKAVPLRLKFNGGKIYGPKKVKT